MLFRDQFHIQLAALKQEALKSLLHRLKYEFHLFAVMAAELEFYVPSFGRDMNAASMLGAVDRVLEQAGIDAHPAEEERGRHQFEVALKHSADIQGLAADVQRLPDILRQTIEGQGGSVDFRAKPYPDDFGSGLHLHLHLQRRRDENLFTRDEDGHYSRELLWSLGGLLELLPESLLLFAPQPESYTRFQQRGRNAPTTISWGANNRTVALRLPDKPLNWKHIEHRVAGADADPQLAMLGVLAGVCHGLQHKLFPGEAIYGDASDAQYELDPLPDYRQALRLFERSEALPQYLGEELYGEIVRRVLMPAAF